MTDSGSDDQTRVGNAERERAIGLLNNALTDGYLDIHEFDSIKDRAGPPEVATGGPTVRPRGSLFAWSNAVIRRN